MSKSLLVSSIILGTISFSSIAQEEVNVYSYRQPFLIEPMFEEFTKETGIRVNVQFSSKGIAEKLASEGEYSPADVILTSEFSRLFELADKKLVQPVQNDVINKNIPAKFRDSNDEWFALTKRARSVYSSKERVGKLSEDFQYLDLADDKYKGKICTRSGKHPYNIALVASMIAHYGVNDTKSWLEGVKENLARKPQGNDRSQVKAIKEGLCDVSLGNSYYLGKMLNDPQQKAWAESVYINFPNQTTLGAHVNVSGMAMAKYAPNRDNAEKLMEFLTSDTAQHMYAEVNYEYPVKEGVATSKLVASWGSFKEDSLPLEKIAENHEKAVKLIDEVKFDL
ncbi:Fe(3+) ABC transporter substrate-binding protein [Vibrio viridaestus]|uniref:Fe(3+) ABC transporter substrate-binding protein n=1 Tax=Vibrio viridaestus TaxID=2487322 RepID=A0A3N9TIC9_9VIBR|nr:Fe(3+) ABC transporter substrate-binding protein [Vibrio viridaestus]RQW63840.1 Fe(3+) ABC transporter substrate-binding protein [Vibrio viridaestus]